MQAWLCENPVGVDALAWKDVTTPLPGDSEVRVRIEAASLNFPDLLIVQNKYQMKPALPFVPGSEYAGTIDAVGAGVDHLTIGQRVACLAGTGGFGTYAVAPAAFCMPLTAGFPAVDAAAFIMTYATSHHALVDRAALAAGETLLVLGAAGGVGTAAVQIGKVLGARVIAAASTDEKCALCRSIGADVTINYTRENLRDAIKAATGGKGPDVIYDPVGGEAFDISLRCVAPEGRLIPMGFASGTIPQIPANILLVKNVTVIGFYYGYYNGWGGKTAPSPKEAVALAKRRAMVAEAQKELTRWFTEGKLKAMVSGRFALGDWVKAFKTIEDRTVVGKAVLVP